MAPASAAVAYAALLPTPADASVGPGSGAESDAVVLVAQKGSLFGIPAAHLTFEAASAEKGAGAAGGGQCQMPDATEQQLVRERQIMDSAQDGALELFHQHQRRQSADGGQLIQHASLQCKPMAFDSGYCASTVLGVHVVQRYSASSLLLLPSSANGSAAVPLTQRQLEEKRLGSWVVLLAGTALGATASVIVVAWTLRRQAATTQQQQQSVIVAAPSSQSTAIQAGTPSSKGRRKGGNSKRQPHHQQLSNHVKGLMQQAALLDVKGQQAPSVGGLTASLHEPQLGHQEDDSLPSSSAMADGLTNPAIQARQVKDGVILVGRMRASAISVLPLCLPFVPPCMLLIPDIISCSAKAFFSFSKLQLCLPAGRAWCAGVWQRGDSCLLRRAGWSTRGSEAHAAAVLRDGTEGNQRLDSGG